MDVSRFYDNLEKLLAQADGNGCKAEALAGKDLLLEACRLTTGNPDLILTKAERQEVKLIAFAKLYGAPRLAGI